MTAICSLFLQNTVLSVFYDNDVFKRQMLRNTITSEEEENEQAEVDPSKELMVCINVFEDINDNQISKNVCYIDNYVQSYYTDIIKPPPLRFEFIKFL